MDSQSPMALILVGQSELKEKLRLQAYAAVRQRIDIQCEQSDAADIIIRMLRFRRLSLSNKVREPSLTYRLILSNYQAVSTSVIAFLITASLCPTPQKSATSLQPSGIPAQINDLRKEMV
jgi:type II secretory pathway predicted ATPase ExeA